MAFFGVFFILVVFRGSGLGLIRIFLFYRLVRGVLGWDVRSKGVVIVRL